MRRHLLPTYEKGGRSVQGSSDFEGTNNMEEVRDLSVKIKT